MSNGENQRSVIVRHKRWGDFWSSVSIVLTIGLFIVVSYVMDMADASAQDRTGALILLGTIIVVVVVWQAVALGIARLEMALRAPRDQEF